MLCIDKFSKYCAILPINGKTESDLALGFIECMNKMGRPPKVIMTDGEGAIKNGGLFSKVFHGTSYNIHTVKRSSGVRRKDDQNFQGDVRQTNQTRPSLGGFYIPSITDLK